MIYLAQVLSELKEFRCSVPATLIGGIVDRGFSENDIDLLYHGLSLTPQKVASSLTPELNRRLHLVAEEEIGQQAKPPQLVIGGSLLWDYAQKKPFWDDEFLEQSTKRWLKPLVSRTEDRTGDGGRETGPQSSVSGLRILDVGCGDGFAMQLFSFYGAYPVGISTAEEEVHWCREQGLEAYLMDQNWLDFDDQCFDVVWSHHTLEHSVAPILAVKEAARVLKPNGIFDLTVGTGRVPGHHYRFDQTTLENLLTDCGFKIENSREARCGFSPEIHFRAIKECLSVIATPIHRGKQSQKQ